MILSDRRKTYYKNNDKYCENNCEFIGYNYTNSRAICKCPVKKEINYEIKKLEFNTSDLSSFFDISTYANLAIVKCYKLAFSKEGQKSNYGSYLILILNIVNIIIMIIFYYNYKMNIQQIITSDLKDIYAINNAPPRKINDQLSKVHMQLNDSNKNIQPDNSKTSINQETNNKINNDNRYKKNLFNNNLELYNKNKKIFCYNDEELNSL